MILRYAMYKFTIDNDSDIVLVGP